MASGREIGGDEYGCRGCVDQVVFGWRGSVAEMRRCSDYRWGMTQQCTVRMIGAHADARKLVKH